MFNKPEEAEERARSFLIVQDTLKTFAADIGGLYVPNAKLSRKEFDHIIQMGDFSDTWIERIFQVIDPGVADDLKMMVKESKKLREIVESQGELLRKVAVDCQFKSFSIRFDVWEDGYLDKGFLLTARVLALPKTPLSLAIWTKPFLDTGPNVVEWKSPRERIRSMCSAGAWEWAKLVPEKMYRLRWKSPMLQDKLLARATDRLLGELLVNDQRVRASFLNIRKLVQLFLFYPDLYYCDVQSLLYRSHLAPDDVRHLKDILKLMQDILDVCIELEVMER